MIQVIHWAAFAPTDGELQVLVLKTGQSIHIRQLLRRMVRNCLNAYPWQGRADLVALYDPAGSYQTGQVLALPMVDPQGIRPDGWRSGVVKSIQAGENPLQGKFQVVQLVVDGKEHWLAAALEGAQSPVLRFPPDEDELDFVVDDFVNHYLTQLAHVIDELIASGKLNALRQGEQVIFGQVTQIHADFAPWFEALPAGQSYLTADELILNIWEVGELNDASETLAYALVEKTLLERGYLDVGGGRWMTPEKLAELDRQISRRLEVPRIRSKIKAQLGDVEELVDEDWLDLPECGRILLRDLDMEADETPQASEQAWAPPASPLKMPALSYLNIMQGYFPLNETLLNAFPPGSVLAWVDIQIVEGEELPFVLNLDRRELKSQEPQAIYRRCVSELGIPAGTFLWLEYRGENRYRIAPRALAAPRPVPCKQAWLEEGQLRVQEVEIEMRCEGDEHLFRAELRFEDMAALFCEAEERGQSIFDAIYDALPKLADLTPDGLVHHKDIFNAVFFEYRMCSYHTVVHELYDHACFVEAGNGFFRFAPELGVGRRRLTRRQAEKAFWKPQPVEVTGKKVIAPVVAEFWRQIASEIPRKLHTLDQQQPFEITSVTHESIEMVVSTGHARSLTRMEVEQAWNELNQRGQIGRERVSELADFNVAYVMAILAALPGVRYTLRPLHLNIKNEGAEQTSVEKTRVAIDNQNHVDELEGIRAAKIRSGQFIAPDFLPPEPPFATQSVLEVGGMPSILAVHPALEPVDRQEQMADEFSDIDTKSHLTDEMTKLNGYIKPVVNLDDLHLGLKSLVERRSTRQIAALAQQKVRQQLESNDNNPIEDNSQEVVGDSDFDAAILSIHNRVKFDDKKRTGLIHHPAKNISVPEIPI